MSLNHLIVGRPEPGILRLRDTPDGGGLFTTSAIEPGQIVMVDNPVALYPSCLDSLRIFCSYCFRVLPSELLHCPHCQEARFCSAECLERNHPHLICHALPNLVSGKASWFDDILFLLTAYSLSFRKIFWLLPLDLNSIIQDETMEKLHFELASLCPAKEVPSHFNPKITFGLISKKKHTSFALKTPKDPRYESCGVDGARAYGLYQWGSMLNHNCIPNVCRFNYVDYLKPQKNTSFVFRALHALKEGVEITINYVDVAWGYRERQNRLIEDYGLKCDCRRCKIESQWKDNKEKETGKNNKEGTEIEEKNDEESEEKNEQMNKQEEVKVSGEELEMLEGSDDNSQFLINDYIKRHICACGAFLAPTPVSEVLMDFIEMECNGCGSFSEYKPGDPWNAI